MRFEYEKLTPRSIARRVAEHETQTGKVVEKVVLTHSEWIQFINDAAPGLYHDPRPEYASFRLHRAQKISSPLRDYVVETTSLIVVPEPSY